MEVLEHLLSVGANVGLLDEDGDTPLMVAETPEIFARLIAAGADPKIKNTEGKGIVEKAVDDDNEALINWFKENGYITDPNFTYTPGESAEMEEFMDMLEPVEEGEGEGEAANEEDEMQGQGNE